MDQYLCLDDERRLEATRADGTLNGIDMVEVDGGHPDIPPQRTLLVRTLLDLPAGLTGSGVRVLGGVRADPAINPVRVVWAFAASRLAAARAAAPDLVSQRDVDVFGALPQPARLLVVRTSSAGDYSTYRFAVTDPQAHDFDPRLAQVPFTFKVDCPSEFDCRVPAVCPTERVPEPPIDYLSRDYVGLRQLLFDRLSLAAPQWIDRNVADSGVALVELFAYLGDHLAYAQDAVAAEAYLGTARRRVSVRRHARLLDYPMHDGVAARTWLVLDVESAAGDGATLAAGTEAVAGSQVFRTLHPVTARLARTRIGFYTWGDLRCCLPRGATRATLRGTAAGLGLVAGEVLLFEEVRGGSGRKVDADPAHRWAVRLIADPVDATDPLTGVDVIEVAWADGDALPFPLCLWRFPAAGGEVGDEDGMVGAAVAHGNVVLAEHGTLVGPEPLVPAVVPDRGRYRPALDRIGLLHAVPYDDAAARGRPAAEAMAIDPAAATPAIVALTDGRDTWTVRRDLLGSDRFAPEFVVETEDDRRAYLRFGDDVLGRRPAPGTQFEVTYRIGAGRAGNVGRDALTRLAAPVAGISVRNPMPATGGADPEPVEQVRQWAPQAFRVQQRAVTDADYAAVTERHPQVQRAAATRRWTGSWYTEFVTVDRRSGGPVEAAFRAEIAAFLERYRMAGYDVEVDAPIFVPLDIVLTVCVAPGYFRANVKRALLDAFSARDLPDGRPLAARASGVRGFFHPDNFTFAQPVYLSRVVAAAMSVDGVAWVDSEVTKDKPNRFQRWGRLPAGEREAGRIPMGRLEIARCDSDPNQPENGRIDFVMAGGL
ncbi:MAG TPA: putative baseplate assembly protein [Pilimelia sp.]|nr:putative baseplate assembly protein [Pilimelia sp.]